MRWSQIFSIYSVIVLYKLGTGEILMTKQDRNQGVTIDHKGEEKYAQFILYFCKYWVPSGCSIRKQNVDCRPPQFWLNMLLTPQTSVCKVLNY